DGIERIIEVELDEEETKMLADSANSVKSVMKDLDDMKIL
ncbi:MAG: malate dehydrogenase, partial [Bacteroidetes bacterium]|nr:malate dehydrogenase [Bacteroidota bacterium]